MNKRHYFNRIGWSFIFVLVISILEYALLKLLQLEWLQISIIVLFTIVKVGLISRFAFKSIFDNVVAGVSYHVYLIYIFTALLIFIVSFAFDFNYIYLIDNQSFAGIDENPSIANVWFRLFFLSTMFFTMQGVMDVTPASNLAEFYILLESIASYSSLIFFLSNFSNLRKTLRVLKRGISI